MIKLDIQIKHFKSKTLHWNFNHLTLLPCYCEAPSVATRNLTRVLALGALPHRGRAPSWVGRTIPARLLGARARPLTLGSRAGMESSQTTVAGLLVPWSTREPLRWASGGDSTWAGSQAALGGMRQGLPSGPPPGSRRPDGVPAWLLAGSSPFLSDG